MQQKVTKIFLREVLAKEHSTGILIFRKSANRYALLLTVFVIARMTDVQAMQRRSCENILPNQRELWDAVSANDTEALGHLLRGGVDPNFTMVEHDQVGDPIFSRTSLVMAVILSREPIVACLLQHTHIDVNRRVMPFLACQGYTALDTVLYCLERQDDTERRDRLKRIGRMLRDKGGIQVRKLPCRTEKTSRRRRCFFCC